MYAKRIDTARKAVAIAFAVCGVAYVVCVRRLEWLEAMRWDLRLWPWGCAAFGMGLIVCLIATFSLTVEALMRRWKDRPLTILELIQAGLIGIVALIILVRGLVTLERMYPSPKQGPTSQDQEK